MAMARREYTTINTLFNRNEVMSSELQRFNMVSLCDGVHCQCRFGRHVEVAAVCVVTAGSRTKEGGNDFRRCPSV